MDKTPDWTLYRSFLSVLDNGSLSAAARILGTTQPTLGRHVVALEHALKLVLFTRSQTGLRPTKAALALRPFAESMAHTAAALQRAAASQGEGASGVVRITASEVIGVEVLPPIIAALREQHPALLIELVLSDRVQDLLHREADIAVRMLRPSQDQLIARRIGAIELGLHASADYLSRHGAPADIGELTGRQHALIGFDEAVPFIRSAAKSLHGLDRQHFAIRADSNLAQLALIRAGAGIGICQVALAARGEALHRVLHRQFRMQLETWITMHEDLRSSLPCRVCFDALAVGLGQYIATGRTGPAPGSGTLRVGR